MVTKMADQEQTVEPVPEPAVPEVAEPTENPAGSAENDENENQNAVTENQDTEGENQNTENEGQNADDETQNAETENKAEDENQIAETDNQNAENENENAENENPSAENENPNAESETPNAENENQNASPPEGEAGDDVPPAAAGEEGEKAAETEGTEQQQEGKPAEGEGAAEGAAAEAPGGDAPAAEGADGAEEQKADGEAPKEKEEGAQQPEGEGEEAAAAGEDGVQLTDIDEGAEAMDVPMILESEAFADGERPESPVIVGERLSRGGTPTEEEQEGLVPIPPGSPLPTTPDRVSAIGEEEDDQQEAEPQYEEEEYDEPEFDRDQLIEKYHQALAERQQLQEQNYQLQHKLADYFMKKKSEDTRQDMDKNVTDQEQRYLKYMANLDDLRRQDTEEREYFKGQIEELKDKCQDKQERVNDERFKFMEFKKEIALNSVNSRSGKPIPAKDVEVILSKENNKEAEVVTVRLENIKLKNKLKKKEMMLKSKEELAEGLHLIDFEQLKIENQTYNEKIEERNEELLKLRKKITSTVEVLTHLKEKLQFVQGENGILKGRLREVEDKAGKKRDILSRTKQARDALRIDNQKLRQNCGLLGNTALLRDFEERKDEGDDLRQKLDSLKMQHAELTLNLNGVRRKIEQAKVGTTNV